MIDKVDYCSKYNSIEQLDFNDYFCVTEIMESIYILSFDSIDREF